MKKLKSIAYYSFWYFVMWCCIGFYYFVIAFAVIAGAILWPVRKYLKRPVQALKRLKTTFL